MRRLSKKGQLTLGDAPTVVLLVGLVFLVMATLALISSNFGDAVAGTQATQSVINESLTPTDEGVPVINSAVCGFQEFSVSEVYNDSTGTLITVGNYSTTATGSVINLTSEYPATPWNVSYSFVGGGVACNTTASLNTEISNNTSIAGIVLTISLVGIILGLLVGVFLTIRRRTI